MPVLAKKKAKQVFNPMQSNTTKKFLKRYPMNVKDDYLFSPAEIKQKLATINLFEAFDADGSGALDSNELTDLYNS